MSDYLIKALAAEDTLRVFVVDATATVSEAQKRHDTWRASSAALGRTLVGTLLLSAASLKGADTLTVKISGDGPAGNILAEGNAFGDVKGYIQEPHVHLPLNDIGKIDVKGAVGTQGFLTVSKDLGLKQPFTGQVPLVSGELGEDFTYYLAASEQIPSAVGVSVFVNADNSIASAGGLLIQVLPGASEETLQSIEEHLQQLPLISQLMRDGLTPEAILSQLFPEPTSAVKILEKIPVQFKCDYDQARFARGLASLGRAEIERLIEEDGQAEVVCHFCGEHFHFSKEELERLLP